MIFVRIIVQTSGSFTAELMRARIKIRKDHTIETFIYLLEKVFELLNRAGGPAKSTLSMS